MFGGVRKSDGLKVAIKEVAKSKVNVTCDDLPLEVSQNTVIRLGIHIFFLDHHPAAGEGHPRGGHHTGLARDGGHFLHRDGEVPRPGSLRLHFQSGQPR